MLSFVGNMFHFSERTKFIVSLNLFQQIDSIKKFIHTNLKKMNHVVHEKKKNKSINVDSEN